MAKPPPPRPSIPISPASRSAASIPPASCSAATIPPASRSAATIPPASRSAATIPPASRGAATIPPASLRAPTARPLGRPRGPFTQHRRLDSLRALLQRHPDGLTIQALAGHLGVTIRSLRRYLVEVRRELSLVSTSKRPGGARLWRLAAGEVPRKIEVRRTQAYALLATRRLFEPMRGTALHEEMHLASERLLDVARRPGRGPNAGVEGARLEERFLYLPFAPKDYASHTVAFDDLFQAVAALRPLRCRYLRDGREERLVLHPYALVLYKDGLHCLALDVERGEVQSFLLDGLSDTECLVDEHFELPADFRVDDYYQGQFGLFRGGEPRRVVIDFEARVAEYVRMRRVHPSQALAPLPGGGVRLTLELGALTELTTWVLGFGDTARVVEPQELIDRVKRELAGALGLYT